MQPIVRKLEVGKPIPEGWTVVKVQPDGTKAIVKSNVVRGSTGLFEDGADTNTRESNAPSVTD